MKEVTPEKILERAKVLHPQMVWTQVCIRSLVLRRRRSDGTISELEAEHESNLIQQLGYIAFKAKFKKITGEEFVEILHASHQHNY